MYFFICERFSFVEGRNGHKKKEAKKGKFRKKGEKK